MQTHAASKISKKINYLQGIIQTKMSGSGVFETWLKKLNRKMAFEKRCYFWTMRHPIQQLSTATKNSNSFHQTQHHCYSPWTRA